MSAYRVISLDLSAANPAAAKRELISPNTAVEQLTVVALPPGTDLQLYLGDKPDALPVRAEGMQIEWDACDPENDGIFYTNVAQQGVIVQIYIGFGAQVSARR